MTIQNESNFVVTPMREAMNRRHLTVVHAVNENGTPPARPRPARVRYSDLFGTDNAAIGRRLKALRLVWEMSQRDCARDFGVSAPSWNDFENGHKRPSIETAARIIEAFAVPLEFIY